MAKVVRGVDSYKKEFLSIFNSLCGRHGRWEVWSDFIQLTAIDISNVTDKGNAPKRAADARNIAKKYSEDEIKRMAEMLMQMVYAIDEKPDQDFLGELYMTCELGNDHAGQFFTPYSVCQAMSEISFDPARFEDIGFVSVNDCACGAGALLVSFANVCKRHDINYQQKVMFVAQDIDYTVGLMCYIQLSLMGCAGYVVIGDTLINPCTAYDKKGLLPTTRREIVRLRDYAKKHQLKEHRLPAGAAMESVDLTCPFRNEETKRCEVYPVRPLICRTFICSRTLQAARKTRDLVQSDRDIHSLRWEIFKNPESIALIQAAQRVATEK